MYKLLIKDTLSLHALYQYVCDPLWFKSGCLHVLLGLFPDTLEFLLPFVVIIKSQTTIDGAVPPLLKVGGAHFPSVPCSPCL